MKSYITIESIGPLKNNFHAIKLKKIYQDRLQIFYIAHAFE